MSTPPIWSAFRLAQASCRDFRRCSTTTDRRMRRSGL